MECNKDEAKRAMDIAERKIAEKDYNGAKKFATKAQILYPHLDGLKQLLMTVEVYISGEKKIGGEADWYGILGVEPYADDEEVRKQYRKLALMLHPDKNKSKGAEGAFNLITEAWSLLSDQLRRFSYNLKRQVNEGPESLSRTQRGIPPHQPTSNGFQNVREPVVSKARAGTKPAPPMDRSRMDSSAFVSSIEKENATFWTKCKECKTQYEFLRIYLNQTLLCPTCRVGFAAIETTPPASVRKPANLSFNIQHQSSKNLATNKNSYGTSSRREPAPSANVVQQAQDRLKRGFGESQERDATKGFTNSDLQNFKKLRTDDSHMSGPFAGKWSNQISASRLSNPSKLANGNTGMPNTVGSGHPQIPGMLLTCDITRAAMNKALQDIFKRLPKMISNMAEDVKATERGKKDMMKGTRISSKANKVERTSGSVEEISNDSDAVKDDGGTGIVVPDSDFHDFDLDRSENSFRDDQIWAAYDDDDGMPRFYARIQKVVSLNPFKMRISWLSSKSCSEFGPIDWVGSGFAKSCGDFRTGRYELTDTLNVFSHKVDFTKGARGVLHILPKKGQVWALYRNWSPEWDENIPDEVIHKYDMVEVLDNYTQDKGSVTVTLLLKVEGFKAIFRRSTDEEDVRKIAKEEMFRFSHQVPHYILTGKEADNAPEGCLELDPAATPCELFSEAKEPSKKENEKSETAKEKSSAPDEEMGMNLD